jgi:hypothetical protein
MTCHWLFLPEKRGGTTPKFETVVFWEEVNLQKLVSANLTMFSD